jgi:hypothetical protein
MLCGFAGGSDRADHLMCYQPCPLLPYSYRSPLTPIGSSDSGQFAAGFQSLLACQVWWAPGRSSSLQMVWASFLLKKREGFPDVSSIATEILKLRISTNDGGFIN